MRYNLSVFWFRRDLRLHDNHGFFQALDKSKSVLPIFIFDINILDELNENDRRVSLLFDRLKELNKELAKQGKKFIYIMVILNSYSMNFMTNYPLMRYLLTQIMNPMLQKEMSR